MPGAPSPEVRTSGYGPIESEIAWAAYQMAPSLRVSPAKVRHLFSAYLPYWGTAILSQGKDLGGTQIPGNPVMGQVPTANDQMLPDENLLAEVATSLKLMSKPAIGFKSMPVVLYMDHKRTMDQAWLDIHKVQDASKADMYVQNYPLVGMYLPDSEQLLKQVWDRHYRDKMAPIFDARREVLNYKGVSEDTRKYALYILDLQMTKEADEFMRNVTIAYASRQYPIISGSQLKDVRLK
jgi:hypothetical protein